MPYQAGTAWLDVKPSLRGFHTNLQSQLKALKPTLEVQIKPVVDRAQFKLPAVPAQKVAVRAEVDRRSFSTAVIQVAALGRALGSIALPAALVAATPAVASLGASAVAASGALGLLPAAGLAAGAAIGALTVGTQGFGDAMKNRADPTKFAEAIAKLSPAARDAAVAVRDLAPAWTGLRLDVQEKLFTGVADAIQVTSERYLPVLKTGLGGIAEELRHTALQTVAFVNSAQTVGDVRTIFDNTRASVHELNGVGVSLGSVFRDVAAVGSTFLPGLAHGAANAAERFREFVGEARATGRLREWISGGLSVLGELGQLAGSVGRILGAIFDAAQTAGGSFLTTLKDLTDRLATFLQSGQGQTALVGLFTTIKDTVAALMPALEAVLPALGTVISVIGPAIPPLATAFSALVTAVAPLIPPLSEIVAVLAGALADAVTAVLPFIETLAGLLGDLLLDALNALKPVFPVLVDVIKQLAPILSEVATILAQGLATAIEAIAPVLPTIADAFGRILLAVAPLLPPLAEMATQLIEQLAPILPTLVDAFIRLVDAVLPLLPAIFDLAMILLPPLLGLLVWLATRSAENSAIFTNFLIPAIGFVIEVFKLLVEGVRIVVDWIGIAVRAIVDGWNWVRDSLAAAWGFIRDSIWTPIIGFIQGVFTAAWNWIRDTAVGAWNFIRDSILGVWNFIRDNIWNPIIGFIQGPLAAGWTFVRDSAVGAWNAIRDGISGVWNFLRDRVFAPLVALVTDSVPQAFQRAVDAVGRIWAGIKSLLAKPINFMINTVYTGGIKKAWDVVAGLLPGIGPAPVVTGIPEFARGGPVTRDSIIRAGEAGPEYVLSAPAVRGLGGMRAVDELHRDAARRGRVTVPDLNTGRYVEGADHDGPGSRTTGFGGVRPHVAQAGWFLKNMFGIGSVGGVGQRANASDHPKGLALDFMTHSDQAKGDRLVNYLLPRAGHFAVKYIIWKQRINSGGGWRGMEDRGSVTANHFDHPHVSFLDRPGGGGPFAGGGGGGGFFDIKAWIREQVEKLTNPAIDKLRSTFPAPPRYMNIPPAAATKVRDMTLDYFLGKAFDNGGVARGRGILFKNVIAPERVLNPRETVAFEQLVSHLQRGPVAAGVRPAPAAVLNQGGVERELRAVRELLEQGAVGAQINVNGSSDPVETARATAMAIRRYR